MYLIEGDNIEILEERKNWIKFIYFNEKNRKEIKGWLKRSDIE